MNAFVPSLTVTDMITAADLCSGTNTEAAPLQLDHVFIIIVTFITHRGMAVLF